MTSQEIEQRTDPPAAEIAAVPVPRQLQEIGVKIGRDTESGHAVVYLPDALRQVVNIVNPVSSFVQSDPNWTPGISLVTITEDQTYPLPGGKKGLSKQALEALSKAAGVLYTRTARVPREELQEGELWAYRATVGFRRSDGTIDEVTRERGFTKEPERAEIEAAVTKGGKFGATDSAAWKAEVEKRWLNELRFGPSKTESKAINRALRAGLGIPSSVEAKALAKPWLVIGFNFTPNYDDPETRRALVAVAMNAQAAIYGGSTVSDKMPELSEGDIPAEAVTPSGSSADVAEGEPEAAPVATDAAKAETSGGDGEQAEASPAAEASAPRSDEPEIASDEPPLDEPKGGSVAKIPERVIDEAGAMLAKGDFTIAQAAERKSKTWIVWAFKHLDTEDPRIPALRLYLEHRAPELWAEVLVEMDGEVGDA